MRWPVVVAVLLLITVGAAGPSGAAGFDLTVPGSLDTPTRTVDLGGNQYEVSAIAKANPGGSIAVNVDVPNQESYRVFLYNADQQVVDQQPGTGDGSFTFTLANPPFEPGSYAISLFQDGIHQTIHPLVVEGFAVDVDAPDEIDVGTDLAVTIDVTQTTAGKSLEKVEFAVVNESTTVRTTAGKDSPGTYTATVATSNLDPGTYRMYAAVRGSNEAFGKKERLGVSDASTLQITSQSTDTETPSDDGDNGAAGGGGGGGGGASGIGRVDTATPTEETTTRPSVTTTDTGTTDGPTTDRGTARSGTPDDRTDDPGTEPGDRSADGSTSEGATPTQSSVITPAPTPTDTTPTETPGQDGFGHWVGLLAMAIVGLWARRRST